MSSISITSNILWHKWHQICRIWRSKKVEISTCILSRPPYHRTILMQMLYIIVYLQGPIPSPRSASATTNNAHGLQLENFRTEFLLPRVYPVFHPHDKQNPNASLRNCSIHDIRLSSSHRLISVPHQTQYRSRPISCDCPRSRSDGLWLPSHNSHSCPLCPLSCGMGGSLSYR